MRKEMVVQIAGGLEARPIAVLVQVASQYESSIHLEADGNRGTLIFAISILAHYARFHDSVCCVTIYSCGLLSA